MKMLWNPTKEQVEQSNLYRFMQKLHFSDYGALHQWSLSHPELFWEAVFKFCEIKTSKPYHAVLAHPENMEHAKWFQGAELNFAENLLRFKDEHLALIAIGEDGKRNTLTYQELFQKTIQLAEILQTFGVEKGDRVAGYLPNIAESVIAMLATTSLGAIWSSCSPDFGEAGVIDRFLQIKPKVLFAVEAYSYNGKKIDCRPRIAALSKNILEIKQVILIEYLKWDQPEKHDFSFVQVPFNHPAYILYSSGTTGVPKCIIHGVGGTLIQHLKELCLHVDLKRSDTLFYFTTCGWMMWNWLVSGLAVGATLVLYDGSPIFPTALRLFDLIDQEKITVFGTSTKFLSSLQKSNLVPRQSHALTTVRSILSTGSPLSPELFDYVYEKIKAPVQVSSISGGTDIISCFALGNPLLPVYRGALQCIGLGMHVKIFNEMGKSVVGEKGQLVCTTPFPSQPIGFWNDPDGAKYHQAYFALFPNIWAHGDYAEITPQNGVIIYGRSDTVLNPGGVRIGTAEIYRPLESIEEIQEAIAVGQQWQNDERILLFVQLKSGIALTDALIQKISHTIRKETTPRHVPAKIIAVPDIPKTLNGKLAELAVKNIIHGLPVRNKDALANPEALVFFRDFV